MSWKIGLIDNTVEITPECEQDVQQFAEELNHEELVEDGFLYFEQDHREHMDYMSHPLLLAALAKHRVNGDITFGSLEGDNAGEFWGYRFVDGVMTKLTGDVIYEEV